MMSSLDIERVIDSVLPMIQYAYGSSKFQTDYPTVELHRDIFHRLTGEMVTKEQLIEMHMYADAEYEYETNTIYLYYTQMNSEEDVVRTLIHEYQHYLQSPTWMKRYYTMGYEYDNHPYEVAAIEAEEDYEMFKW